MFVLSRYNHRAHRENSVSCQRSAISRQLFTITENAYIAVIQNYLKLNI